MKRNDLLPGLLDTEIAPLGQVTEERQPEYSTVDL
jgi:hypothetical protein